MHACPVDEADDGDVETGVSSWTDGWMLMVGLKGGLCSWSIADLCF